MKIYKLCFVKFLVFALHLSVALNISFSLLSAAELGDGITKLCDVCIVTFGFHGAANAKESRLCAHPDPLSNAGYSVPWLPCS